MGNSFCQLEIIKKLRFSIPILAAAVAFSGSLVFQPKVQARPGSVTTFRCISSGNGFATVALRDGRQSDPMIIWQSYAFGREYTPEQRCKAVSYKLTQAVASNGGRLTNLILTTGYVNGLAVICYVNSATSCNGQNVLLTLNPENAKDPGKALASLLRFGKNGTDTTLHESAQAQNSTVSLEAAVEQAFATASSQNPNPQSVGNSQSSPATKPNSQTNGNQW